MGDHFAWFIENCLPQSYYEEAASRGMNIHKFLREKAQKQRPGESGLLALDWWNGNRSVLVDADLTGMMLGMTLQTKPEEIYRALIEATAYGTRMIIENYREHGVPVHAFVASGGISQKDPMTMQIYADVINMPIKIAGSAQGPALGLSLIHIFLIRQEGAPIQHAPQMPVGCMQQLHLRLLLCMPASGSSAGRTS